MTSLKKAVHRVANKPLSGMFGSDRDKRIVVSLIPGNGKDVDDLIELRPERTRRAEVIAVCDVYLYALKCRVNRGQLEKARQKKVQKQEARERAAIARADKKLRKQIKESSL